MKRKWISLWIVIFGLVSPVQALAAQLVPVGEVVGLALMDDSVTVVAYDDTVGRVTDLKIGDEIVKIDGMAVDCAQDVRMALENCSDGQLEMVVSREGKQYRLDVTPKQTADGLRLGVYLRQGITGVGTVTYYDPDSGCFGALGHGVSNGAGELLDMTSGTVYNAQVEGVERGKAGAPGQLRGAAQGSTARGELAVNSAQGVFGKTEEPWQGTAIPTAAYGELKTGPAFVRCTVAGREVQEYSVEILKIYPQDRSDGRNLLIRVTDTELLDITGGIVQGMSGSPIIQDGKLVGAVTHVLVNDPTRGYGIFIENMLEAAE